MMLAGTLGEYPAPRKRLIKLPPGYWWYDLNENMAGEKVLRLVTFELRCHLVARTVQNVMSTQVLPRQGNNRACYSVAE